MKNANLLTYVYHVYLTVLYYGISVFVHDFCDTNKCFKKIVLSCSVLKYYFILLSEEAVHLWLPTSSSILSFEWIHFQGDGTVLETSATRPSQGCSEQVKLDPINTVSYPETYSKQFLIK